MKGYGNFANRTLERIQLEQSSPQVMTGDGEREAGQIPVSSGHERKGEVGAKVEEARAHQ